MQAVTYRLTADNRVDLLTTVNRNIQAWLRNTPDLELVIRPHKSKRSIEQNRRLWKIYQVLADQVWENGRRYSAEIWHEYCKGRFVGYEIHVMPDGSENKIPISTTTLNTAEMSDYQNSIQSHFAQTHAILWEF